MLQSFRAALAARAQPSTREEGSAAQHADARLQALGPSPLPFWSSQDTLAPCPRADAEKGSLHERQPLLAPTAPRRTLAPPAVAAQPSTLAALRETIDKVDDAALASIRRRAVHSRDAAFAELTRAILLEAANKKAGSFASTHFTIPYQVERECRIVDLSDRLTILKKVNDAIQPNGCRFTDQLAEAYACSLIEELKLFTQTMPAAGHHLPIKLEVFIQHMQKMTAAVRCTEAVEHSIEQTLVSVVLHQLWRIAEAAQAAGETADLERYLSLHAAWSAKVCPEAPQQKDFSMDASTEACRTMHAGAPQ